MKSRQIIARHLSRPTGALLAAVLMVSLLALSLWAVGYRRLSALVQLERRTQYGEGGAAVPDLAGALSRAIACLKVQTPPTTPYRCRVGLGDASNPQTFTLYYVDQGSGRYQVTVSTGWDTNDPVCASCDSAAGP